MPKFRCITYIDGFNLYFGMKELNDRSVYWLNIAELSKNLLLPSQELVATKYFTARITGARPGDSARYAIKRNSKRARQKIFLDALKTVPNLELIEGQYSANKVRCFGCNIEWTSHEEKMTDVNIATHMLSDAYQNRFDTAILISADSDLVPPIKSVLGLFPNKKVVAFFPPNRRSNEIKKTASKVMYLNRGHLAKSQLPDKVPDGNGGFYERPSEWK